MDALDVILLAALDVAMALAVVVVEAVVLASSTGITRIASDMAHIANKDFNELERDGSNYLTWAMDVKIYLSSKGLIGAIQETDLNGQEIPEANKYVSLHFISHHLHPDLKNEYMMEENPMALWVALKERYEQQKAVILPEAQCEWSLLRLMDFKFVTEYNSAVHKIASKLRFYDKPVDDAEMIENTLSIFLPTEYCSSNTNNHKFGGKKRNNFKGKWNNNKRQKYKGSYKGKGNFKGNFKRQVHNDNSQACQRCGCNNRITKKFHIAKHLVELYQKSISKGKQVQGDKFEAHFNTQPIEATFSKDVLATQEDNKIPHELENLTSMNDMIMEFQSNDMFGDLI
ncbi:uncharacterized protein LOC102720907 [Oryza brachyantha]|uniref:uncharacterized protein LOC102720907 n=1 Tax=Oryza brachyantha TaxID=4533 RepID=UPI0007761E79|nr:uncharacterized protein LOC102720907 [Oryza brachyantha]